MSAPDGETPGVRAIAGLLKHHGVESPAADSAGAAVFIFLRPTPAGDDVEALLIQRTERSHDPASGQVSLPGGRVDRGDASLCATALRESEEEVGLSVQDLVGPPRYVGTETAHAFGLRVGVFAGALSPSARPPGPRSPEEVAGVFWVPRSALANGRRIERSMGASRRDVEATVVEDHVVWGFTRRVLREFFGDHGTGAMADWTPGSTGADPTVPHPP